MITTLSKMGIVITFIVGRHGFHRCPTKNITQIWLFQLAFWTLNLAHFCSSVVWRIEISLNIFHFLTSQITASSWFMIDYSIFYFGSIDRDWSFIILHLPIILISHKGSKNSSDKPNSGVTSSHSIYRKCVISTVSVSTLS